MTEFYAQFGRNNWISPPEIMAPVKKFFGGKIDLDPMSTPDANRFVGAEQIFTESMDGLSRGWYGNCYVNPPWGRKGGNDKDGKWSWKVGPHMPTLTLEWARKQVLEYPDLRVLACLPSSLNDVWLGQFLLDHPCPVFLPVGRTGFVDPETHMVQKSPTRGAAVILIVDDIFSDERQDDLKRFAAIFGGEGNVLSPMLKKLGGIGRGT